MALVKCRMCGGDLPVTEGITVADCPCCGSRQTLPTFDTGKKVIHFIRAGRLLRACDFDKAAEVYRGIAAEFPEEAEAYWGLVLCRYGVSYLDEPATGKKVPACHRPSFASVMEDGDLEQAIDNADPAARKVYREEAKAIERLRRASIEAVEGEPPYDVFICCQETDAAGQRTPDAAMAQEVCDGLTAKGRRAFFSHLPPEPAARAAGEPYIFAALSSARVMLVFGTSSQRFDDVWVKNEWSRFLALVTAGEEKALIPCYTGMDPGGMPKEFSALHAQDMGRAGAAEELLDRVEGLLGSLADGGRKREELPTAREVLSNRDSVRRFGLFAAAGATHTAAVRGDGSVIAVGYTGDGQCSVAKWRDVIAVAADAGHTVGLKADGTVVAVGKNDHGQCNVAGWTDIVSIAVGAAYTLGVRSDGTVAAAGKNDHGQCSVAGWSEIVAVAADVYRTIGLKSDGTVVVAGWTATLYRSKAVSWRDIVAIASSSRHTVGLKEDGTVTVIGGEGITDWTDIVSVAAGTSHTVGLKADGAVVAAGDNSCGQCDVSDWRDIIAIAAGARHTVGLRVDGTVVATGDNRCGQCEVAEWKLFDDLRLLEDTLTEGEAVRQRKELLDRERRALKKELSGLKGIFTGKRRKELEERLAEIDGEL